MIISPTNQRFYNVIMKLWQALWLEITEFVLAHLVETWNGCSQFRYFSETWPLPCDVLQSDAIFILSLGNLFEQYAEEQIVMLLCDSDNFCCL